MALFRWSLLAALLTAGCNSGDLAPIEKEGTPTPIASVPPGEAAPFAVIAGGSFFSPGETAVFDGSNSYDPDGTIVSFAWTLAAAPAGSTSAVATSGATASLLIDVAGDYTIRLVVTDDDGLPAQAEITLGAALATGLRMELSWPANYGQLDLDAHLVDQSGGGAFQSLTRDCFWYNCVANSVRTHPDWGTSGNAADDPGLDGDNLNQFFPENIVIDDPADGTYRVYVHYFPRPGQDLAATLNVKVYAGTTVIWDADKTLAKDKDLWTGADVVWSGSTATVQVIDTVDSNVQ